MYEPIYRPQLNGSFALLNHIHFGLVHEKKVIAIDDPSIEPLHMHGYLEIFFNISSEVSFLVNNRLYHVPHGSAVVSCSNDIHMCIFEQTCSHDYFCLWIDAPESALLLPFLRQPNFSPLLIFDGETRHALHTLLHALENVQNTAANKLEEADLFLQLVLLLQKPQQPPSAENAVPMELQKILDHIDAYFPELHSVNELTEIYFISPSTLNRWFQRYLHVSPHTFLESKKLAHAAQLLLQGKNVTDACMQSGFSDCSHFIRLFKKNFGETPLKYKQKQIDAASCLPKQEIKL